jgi:polyisoprenoid-binding protein YceI
VPVTEEKIEINRGDKPMVNKLNLKSLRPMWVLIIFVLAACAGTQPTPTPVSPTPTPLPAPTLAESETGEENDVSDSQSQSDSEDDSQGETATSTELRTFLIVPEESRASYLVDEEFFDGALAKLGIEAGDVDVVGSTQSIEGQLQLNFTDLSTPLGTNRFTVNLSTLSTDQSRRDNWIRENGPQFNQYPLAEFVATGVADTPETYTEGEEVQFKMLGDLTIREVTQPVTFDVAATLEGDTATGVATADLRMTDFGIEPPNFANTLTVADEFQVRVEFTAREQ